MTPGGAAGEFWRNHALRPLLALGALIVGIEILGIDRVVAHALYYNANTHQWLGSGPGDWWAHELLHDGGRWIVRLVAAGVLATWLLSFFFAGAQRWRREAAFAFAAIALSVAIVGALKAITNVDCPWDLVEFGGSRPYVTLFGDRPDYLAHARCFPGAHSSSGFALVCFYFVLRDHSRRAAIAALTLACTVGIIFSIGQEARGAHFVSHDLVSATLVWTIQLALYAWMFGIRATPVSIGAARAPSGLRRFLPGSGLPG